uniref:Uncharacterized protein n=1 Tax=Vespula pensylvanica TaxID=30213 RepID=A0A834P405_VESPE|nr:hypothetical protein H0235_007068 [Vespula pensylvanica]
MDDDENDQDEDEDEDEDDASCLMRIHLNYISQIFSNYEIVFLLVAFRRIGRGSSGEELEPKAGDHLA